MRSDFCRDRISGIEFLLPLGALVNATHGAARARFVLATALVAFTAVVSAQAPDRSKPPAPGLAPTLKLPAIQKRQLSNGVAVSIVELHEVPVVQVALVILSGSGEDPPGKYGIASFTSAMLVNGASTGGGYAILMHQQPPAATDVRAEGSRRAA